MSDVVVALGQGLIGQAIARSDGGFITGSDVLMDGGVTASYFFGDLPSPSAAGTTRS